MSKIIKRSLISCLVFVFTLSLGVQNIVNVSAKKCDDLTYDVVGGFYSVSTSDDLRNLACMVNTSNPNYISATVHLINDIDLTGVSWIPIGSSDTPFTGTFDGNNFKISHLTITTLQNSGVIVETDTLFEAGFFGALSNATIRDLTFDQGNITLETNAILSETETSNRLSRIGFLAATVNSETEISGITITDSTIDIDNPSTQADGLINNVKTYVGGLVGESDSNSVITNVDISVDMDIFSTWDDSVEFSIGGVIGIARFTQIEKALFSGNLTFTDLQANLSSNCIGGLIGGANDSSVSNSEARSIITVNTGEGETYLGGIIGLAIASTLMDQLTFKGTIDSDSIIVGGIVGLFFALSEEPQTITISNAVVEADIFGSFYIAGLVGGVLGSLEITDSTFDGNLKEAYFKAGLVGMIAEDSTLTLSRSYSLGTIEIFMLAGGIFGENRGTVILTDAYSRMDMIYPEYANKSIDLHGSSLMSIKPADEVMLYVGGIGGKGQGESDQYTNVYFAGQIRFVGEYTDSITQDPFVNYEYGAPSLTQNIYFDHDLLPMESLYASPKTTAEMKVEPSFVGFDFEFDWIISSGVNEGYPTFYTNLDKVTYQDGSSSTPTYVPHGKVFEKPADPKKANYVFEGWFTDEAKLNPWNFATDVA